MRHDPYSSPWRKLVLVLAFTALAAVIVAGVVTVGQRDSSPSTATSTATPSTQPVAKAPVQPVADKPLTDAVYAFVEAYNLPASKHRNELLKKLSTTEGYSMVFRDPATQSAAEKAAGDITISAVRDSSSIQIEPFDDDSSAASVYAEVTVQIIRDGKIIQTVGLPAQTTSWVKQTDGWKFAFLQP
jgi:hypothetical protein